MTQPKWTARLIEEFTEAAQIAVFRFPNDYDAALRYARDLVSEEGSYEPEDDTMTLSRSQILDQIAALPPTACRADGGYVLDANAVADAYLADPEGWERTADDELDAIGQIICTDGPWWKKEPEVFVLFGVADRDPDELVFMVFEHRDDLVEFTRKLPGHYEMGRLVGVVYNDLEVELEGMP
jgi:hypothetical protein